jgi:hypothetical protein
VPSTFDDGDGGSKPYAAGDDLMLEATIGVGRAEIDVPVSAVADDDTEEVDDDGEEDNTKGTSSLMISSSSGRASNKL